MVSCSDRFLTPPLLLLLLVVTGVGVLTFPAYPYVGDPFAYRLEARSLVLGAGFNVDTQVAQTTGAYGQFFTQNVRTGAYSSKYGVMNSLVNAIPLFVERVITGDVPPGDNPTRTFLLGWLFLGLTLGIAALLFAIGGYYTDTTWVRIVFVLSCLYATFLWNYSRAHNSESTAVLFFLVFWLGVLGVRTGRRGEWLAWTGLLALALTKASFLLLAPIFSAVAIALDLRTRQLDRGAIGRALLKHAIAPAVVLAAIVGTLNFIKFGSPFYTGYHQWNPEATSLTQPLGESLYGFFLSERWSVFTHFPVLLPALIGWPTFWRRYRVDALVALAVFAIFTLAIAKLPSWRGELGYGPRYLLFYLPVVSLPFLFVLDRLHQHTNRARRLAAAAVIVLILGYSTVLQAAINRTHFFFAYDIASILSRLHDPAVREYRERRHFGRIALDHWLHHDHPESLPYYDSARRELAPDELARLLSDVQRESTSLNLWWWRRH